MKTTRRILIVIRGRLSARLAATFDGLAVHRRPGVTELDGEIADQAQLHGMLSRIRDLGLDLESLRSSDVSPDRSEETPR